MHLLIILRFEAQFDYKGPKRFISLKNLALTLVNPDVIDRKLEKDFENGRAIKVIPIPFFILLSLDYVPKHNKG